MNAPTTSDVLTAMHEVGGWYIRKRKYVLPALWRSKGDTFVPASPEIVEEWLRATYPWYATATKRDRRTGAEAVIAEARYHDYGFPVLQDDTLEFVS